MLTLRDALRMRRQGGLRDMLVFQSAPAYTLGQCRHLPVRGLPCRADSGPGGREKSLVLFHVAVISGTMALCPGRAGAQ